MEKKSFLTRLVSKLSSLGGRLRGRADLSEIADTVTDAGYFEQVSYRYTSAQVICMMLLAVYLGTSLLTDNALLSADNLIYFAKDLTASISMQEGEARRTLVYSSDEANTYTLYREGLAVLGKQKLTVFTATGREAHSARLSYQHPVLATSGRYLLAYDLGGKHFSLYNSFTCVKEVETEQPIRGAVACDAGGYAVLTDSDTGGSEVVLYDERHRAVSRYSLKEYTVDVALKRDDSELLFASVISEGGRLVTRLARADTSADQFGDTITVYDTYPVSVSYTEEGNIRLLTTDAYLTFSPTGERLSEIYFSQWEVLGVRECEEGLVLICRANVQNTATCVMAFDKTGKMVYNVENQTAVRDAVYSEGALALLDDGGLTLYQDGQGEPCARTELKMGYGKLLALDGQEFYACSDSKAVLLRPQENG